MPQERTDPTTDADGDEHHPAFGLITVHRVSSSPGQVLFQSDLRHGEYMRIEVHEADRKRDLRNDWVHSRKPLIELSMSMAQFASFVASAGNGSGVPVTVDYVNTGDYEPGHRPGLNPAPRLALSHKEVKAAAHEAFDNIRQAFDKYLDIVDDTGKGSTAARKNALRDISSAISNSVPNVAYAAKTLDEHHEKVVETSRADIEAIAFRTAERLGIPVSSVPAIEA